MVSTAPANSKLPWQLESARFCDMGQARLAAGQQQDALELAEFATNLDAYNPTAWTLAGLAFQALKCSGQAMARLRRALMLDPAQPLACNALGIELLARSLPAEAAKMFAQAELRAPRWGTAALNHGLALQRQGHVSEALEAFHRATRLLPEQAEAWNALGTGLQLSGQPEEAILAYERALLLRPDFPEALNNLGRGLRDLGRLDEAVRRYDTALELDSSYAAAHWNRALVNLLRGRFSEAWEDHEWRWRVPGFSSSPRGFVQPLWQGEDPAGRRILLHAEQGFGDTIQFLRYVPLVLARGAKVILEVQRELLSLARGIPGVAAVVATGDPLPPFDLQVPLLSLPRAFGTTLETIPTGIPYLHPTSSARERWAAWLPDEKRPRIGLVWAGRPTHGNDSNRSLSLERLRPILDVPGLRFFSLQVGPRVAEISQTGLAAHVEDLSPRLTSFEQTAAALHQIDLLVSVDTSVAHLAGACGRPVWMLLPFAPDWRWLTERNDTPWYPTCRLFRQPQRGNWSEPIAALSKELARLTAG